MTKPELRLKPRPDGFGFIYGELPVGVDHYRVVFRLQLLRRSHVQMVTMSKLQCPLQVC